MGINRTDKFILEHMGLASLGAAAELRNRPVVVVLGGRPFERVSIMTHAAVCLLVRCFHAEIWLDPGVETGEPRLEQLESIIQAARTESIRFSGRDRIMVGAGPLDAIRMGIGAPLEGAVRIDAAGWTVGINKELAGNATPIAPAACLSAALGVAKLFVSTVMGRGGIADESWAFSLLAMNVYDSSGVEVAPRPEKLGRVAILGAGAIGSAIGFVLRQANLEVDVVTIDDDHYCEDNLDTTLMLSREVAILGLPKAAALAAAISGGKLRAEGRCERVVAGSKILGEEFGSFICGVDNAETRRILDRVSAGQLINAAVGGTRDDAGHALVSRHDTANPLSKLYGERGGSLDVEQGANSPNEFFGDQCSLLAYQGATMAAPFVALAAGAIAVAQAMRAEVGAVEGPRVVKIDLRGIQHKMELRE